MVTAVWNTPGLKQANRKYGIYSPDAYASQPGFKGSLAFGTLGRDALIAAATQKMSGALATRAPGASGLMTWWNLGINKKVPVSDWFAYEIGQKTLNPVNYEQYKQISDAVIRGRTIISEQGLLRAIMPESLVD